MKETTKKRKKARFGIEAAYGRKWIDDQMFRILATGKRGFDKIKRQVINRQASYRKT